MPSRRKRLSKREIKHDPVIENALAAWTYALRNKNKVIGIGLSVILIVVVVYGLTSYRSAKGRDAETLLSRSLSYLNSEDSELGVELLEELAEEQSGTIAGKRAAYYLAQVMYEREQFSEAKEWFERYVRLGGHDRLLRVAAAKGVADCLVELGDSEAAGMAYRKAAEKYPNTPLTADCLYLAGLALKEAGDFAEGSEALEELIDQYPDYERIGDARVLLGELHAKDLVIRRTALAEVDE